MMSKLKEINLGNDGIEYIKKTLANGKSLSKILLRTFDFQKGEAITYLPSEVSVENAKQFTTGGKLKQESHKQRLLQTNSSRIAITPTPTSDIFLASEILSFLIAGQRRLCIMENALAKPSDPSMAPYRNKITTFDDEVYHYLLREDAQKETIVKTVKVAASYLFIGILSSFPQDAGFASLTGDISLDDLKSYASRTERVIVGAYDGEGYVIWRLSK